MSATIVNVAACVSLVIGGFIARRAGREELAQRLLSRRTVWLVWCFYLWLTAIVVMAAIVGAAPLGWRWQVRIPVALATIAAGLVLITLGILHMHSFRRMSGRDTSELITRGIYRFSRNPQNVGWMSLLAGVSMLGDSSAALLIAGAGVGLFLAYLPAEEWFLGRTFGEPYERYCRRTPAIFGIGSRK